MEQRHVSRASAGAAATRHVTRAWKRRQMVALVAAADASRRCNIKAAWYLYVNSKSHHAFFSHSPNALLSLQTMLTSKFNATKSEFSAYDHHEGKQQLQVVIGRSERPNENRSASCRKCFFGPEGFLTQRSWLTFHGLKPRASLAPKLRVLQSPFL